MVTVGFALDDVKVSIVNASGSASAKAKISDIYLNWTPQSEETFIVGDSQPMFPGLNSVKLMFEGMTFPSEESIKLENNGEKVIELKVPIKGGDATIPLLALNSGATAITLIGGDDTDEVLITSSSANPTVTIDTDTDEYFVVTSVSGKESHLMELSSTKTSSGTQYATFKDVVSGSKYEDYRNGTSFNVGETTIAVNTIDVDESSVSITVTGYMDRVISEGGMTVMLPHADTTAIDLGATALALGNICTNATVTSSLSAYALNYNKVVTFNDTTTNSSNTTTCASTPTTYSLVMMEDDKTEGTTTTDTVDGKHILAGIGITSSKIQVASINTTDYEVGDSDVYEGYTTGDLATQTLLDTNGDQDKLEVVYHGGESYGNLYIGAEGSSVAVSEGSSEGGSTATKIDVGATLLASEVAGQELSQNMIIVGGPCANSAAAAVMGNPADCTAGFEAGKGMIQLFENDGNVAMVVAGMLAGDTRAVTAVVANYGEYDLSGEKMEITTATKAVMQVEVVEAPVEEAPVEEEAPAEEEAPVEE